MAAYEQRLATTGDARIARPLHLSWSALFGGGLIGWGTLFVLSLAGASIGLAKVEGQPSTGALGDHLANIGVGVGLFGLIAMLLASFIGGFFVVRIAGERRRREGMLHGAVSWGLSAVALAILALSAVGGAASTAGQSAALRSNTIQRKTAARETVKGEPSTARLTPREQVALEDTSASAAKAAGATAGALGLSLGLALLGAIIACATLSGMKVKDEFRMRNDRYRDTATTVRRGRDDLDRPTILPPTH